MSEENGYADKSQILAANKRRFADVDVAGVQRLRIRSLTEKERSKYEADFLDTEGKATNLVTGKARLIILCVCDASGRRLFSDADIAAILEMDAVVTNSITDACRSHCGFTDADVEDLAKNLKPTRADDSPSD